jgi:hypothetical protein
MSVIIATASLWCGIQDQSFESPKTKDTIVAQEPQTT